MTVADQRDQARSRTRARIVDTASRLLRDEGARALTTRAVAESAGVQVPTIYRLFGDKDGLLDALAEDALARYVAEKVPGESSDDPVAELQAAWRRHVEFGLENPDLFLLLIDPRREARSPAAEAGLEVLRSRVGRIAAAGLLKVTEQRAVEMIHAAGTGAVLTLLARSPQDRDPALADALFESVMAGVLTEGPETPPDPVASAVVTMRAVASQLDLTASERSLLIEWLDRAELETG